MQFDFISHGEISDRQLDKIAELKATVWSYPIAEHLRWMTANLIPEDIHLMLYAGDASEPLIGYLTINRIEIDGHQCVGIGNVCIHRDLHGKGLGLLLMKLAEYHILTSHSDAWLLCKPSVAMFYEQCGWTPFKGLLTYDGKKIDCNIYKLNVQQRSLYSSHSINRLF